MLFIRRDWMRAAAALFLGLAVGCDHPGSEILPPLTSIDGDATERATPPANAPLADIRDEISVATWNIQVFGQSKIDKPDVMAVIVDMVRRFDVIAIQELRCADQSIIPRFLNMVNQEGYHYDIVAGPRLGRTASKEQYLYLYDTTRIELLAGSVYTIDDPDDRLHREPLVASFRVIGALSGRPWTFTLVNIHTDPDEAEEEVNALDDVIRLVRRTDAEDDVILLGDLNVDAAHLGELAALPDVMWTVTGQPTNTRGNHSYDNILFSGSSTPEFTGAAGIIDLESEYALTKEQALQVSDHLPVWATFAPVEGAVQFAASGQDDANSTTY